MISPPDVITGVLWAEESNSLPLMVYQLLLATPPVQARAPDAMAREVKRAAVTCMLDGG